MIRDNQLELRLIMSTWKKKPKRNEQEPDTTQNRKRLTVDLPEGLHGELKEILPYGFFHKFFVQLSEDLVKQVEKGKISESDLVNSLLKMKVSCKIKR